MKTINVTNGKVKSILARMFLLMSMLVLGTASVYCDGLSGRAVDAMTTVYGKVYDVGVAIFPIIVIALIIALFVTHDERAIKTEIKSLIICVILYAVLLVMGPTHDNAETFINDTLNEDAGINAP